MVGAHAAGADLALRTSGTTAETRAVVRSTDSWWASFEAYSALSGVGRGARVWVPGPLRATMNLFAAVHARVTGAVIVDRPEGADHACLTPTQLERHAADLSPGCRVVVAGATLPEAMADRITDRHRLVLAHYYGAAELSFVAQGSHAGDLRAFPGVEIEERDQQIWVRSAYVSHSQPRDPGGWASVGDRGALEGGRLIVFGRPDAVTTGGATVLLADVEAALAGVAQAPFAVVGVPHAGLGEVLLAVVTDAGDRDRLEHRARTQLPASHRPRVWRVLPALPMTAAGKVDRARLTVLP